jgi:Fe-S cluster assembly protein SufD
VIEHFVGGTAGECFTNAVTEIEVAAGASVEHYRIQQESPRAFHIGHVNARVQQDGRYASHDIALGASLARLNLGTILQGPGAHVALHGLLAPLASQHLDSHTTIDHAAAHTTSDENYRGIAGERGRGVFNGKVIVRPDAQKTDARQSSRNLLLAAGAEIDTKPELEIYANDVKCSHGATTGQLDAAALFYLRSRGLDEAAARTLLIRAFAESILTSIGPAPVRSHLEQLLNERYQVIS